MRRTSTRTGAALAAAVAPFALVALAGLAAAAASELRTQDWMPEVDLASLAEGHRAEVDAARAKAAAAPSDPEAVGELGSVYFGFKFNRAAATCFAHAAELDPKPFRWWYYTALSHRRAQDLEEAIDAFERALAIDDTYAPAHIELADVLIDADAERAREHYARALELDAKAVNAHAGLGRCAAILGETETAIEHFERALAMKRDYGIVHYELAMLLRVEGRMDEAAEHLRLYEAAGPRVVGRDPLKRALRGEIRVPAIVGSRVSQLWEEAKFDEARALIGELLAKDPEQDAFRELLARTYMREGKLVEAEREFRAILEARPGYLESIGGLAAVLEQLDRRDEAVNVLRDALELHPRNGELLHRLALLLANAGEATEALATIARAVHAQPGDALIRLNHGRMLAQANEGERAVAELRIATELDPASVDAFEALATVLEATGDGANAERAWLRVVTLAPKRIDVYVKLARLAEGRRDYARSEEILRAGATQMPESPRLARELGWLLATCPDPARRDGAEAVRWATKGCELTDYERHPYLDALAAAHAEARDFERAVETAKRAIELVGERRPNLARDYARRLALYEAGSPYHEPK